MSLKTTSESFVLIGEVNIPKDLAKYTSDVPNGKNGWMKKTINFGVKISDQNRIFVNQEAGYWNDATIEKTKNETGKGENGKSKKKENFVYNGENVLQEDGFTQEYVADNIPFANRFDKEMMDKVNYNKKIRVSLEEVEDENEVKTYKEMEFLFIGDAIDYVKKHLVHKQRVYIYGKSETSQYVSSKTNALVTKVDRRISQIRIAREDEVNEATGVVSFLFNKESFDKSSFKKDKKYYIQGYKAYKNDEKNIVPVPTTFILDFSSPNVDWENEETQARVEYLTEVFTEGLKKDKIYQTQWKCKLFEGSEEIELGEKDLSKDLQKRVKLGFIDLETAIKQMRNNSVGDKIKETRLVMPLGEESRVETDYEDADLIPPSIDDKLAKMAEKKAESKVEETKKVEDISKKFDAMFD